jgi:hypothetical protein
MSAKQTEPGRSEIYHGQCPTNSQLNMATRWMPFLATLAFAGAIVIDLLYYFVWPTPFIAFRSWMYQEPAKTMTFIVVFLIGAAFVTFGPYWTVTPIPLLQLSASGLVYRPFSTAYTHHQLGRCCSHLRVCSKKRHQLDYNKLARKPLCFHAGDEWPKHLPDARLSARMN